MCQLRYYIGCSGWSYTAWEGPFYPKGMPSSSWLQYYSKVFDYVEIDSTFYRIPNQFMARRWHRATPDNFRFTVKMPGVITHKKRLRDVENELEIFFKVMNPLHDKVLCLLIQLPPSMQVKEGMHKLEQLIPILDSKFRYTVEPRHSSWFIDEAYDFFADNNICMVWTQLAELQTPPIVTTDFLYIRFIGDRSIDTKDFGRIQKDRIKEMQYWARETKKVLSNDRKKQVKFMVASANNHYAGFGPETANIFRKLIGIDETVWEEKRQPTLPDFSK